MIPIKDRVCVRRIERENGLVVLTDAGPSQLAEVVAVGPGRFNKEGARVPVGVKVGDVVLVPGIASRFPDWERDGEMMIQEADIAGVLDFGKVN